MLGKILGGRYELLEKIGGGGMAVVYKAKCHLLKRYVAVKILRPELVENEEFVNRFKRESQAAASLSHPNIVNMYDVGQEGDIHYIVMEYVDGMTLKEYIREKGRLDSEEAVRIASQICSALNHAHSNNIVHRDIKPQNILISKDGTAKVADFGIARAVNSATVTIAGANVIGSVHYFSPEQARGGYVDKKSDIYSLGIVLYEMVTGVVPFEGDSAISVALKHIQEKVTPPGEINPDIPKSIQYIIERAIEKDIGKRYHDTADMLSDLNRALKEPDGAYVKRAIDEEQATRIIPAIHTIPDSLEKEPTKEYNGLDEELEQEEASGKRWNRIWMGISIAFIATVLLVLFMVLRAIYIQNFVRQDTVVPMVEGYDEETARDILESRNLVMNIVEWRHDRDIPEGQVISQNPRDGMTVQAESTVDVVVSLGVKPVIVPDVVNKSQRNAEIELENKGLKVGAPEYVESQIPSGFVVQQDPSALTEVPEGTEVTLYISKGPEDNMTVVGKYIGLTIGMAEKLLESENLKLGTVREEPNSSVNEGIVFKQSPEPGMNVEKGRKVDLWVSKGEAANYRKIIIKNLYNKATVRVKIVRTSDEQVVHDKVHEVTDGVVEIPLKDSGMQSYAIWIDNQYIKTQTLDFTKKESEGE